MDDYGDSRRLYEKNIGLLQLNREWKDKYIYMKSEVIKCRRENSKLEEDSAKLRSELSSLKAASYKTKSNAYKIGITKETLKCYLDEGLSVKEIAKLYSVAPNTIRNRIKEFRLKGVI